MGKRARFKEIIKFGEEGKIREEKNGVEGK